VPEGRLRVAYCERLFTPEGQAEMSAFLGLEQLQGNGDKPEHQGPAAPMRADLVAPALGALRAHYDWAARTVGPLPAEWQASLMKEAA
jgi:hypothetical protein